MNATGTSWKGGQSDEQELKQPFLCLRIGENLFDPAGWVLGSHDMSLWIRNSTVRHILLDYRNWMGVRRKMWAGKRPQNDMKKNSP
ncbi:hypothetical protein MAJ_08845, partial [Metarhizium majus ARSEF 297]